MYHLRINELKINSYGNLKDKNVRFEDGINIVYGDNEKGKSTLLNCIVNMLYGTSKNKKGRSISDYDKFKPWNTEEFSGKMSYELDNGAKYEVYREFGKKNPKLYDENMNDVSKDFSIDKSSGNEFFFEQTGVDEQTFTSTVVSFQNEVELDNQTQNVLLQKIANTSSTGSEDISYKKAIDKLYKKQLEEIGTNRSQGKPINIVVSKINELNNIEQSLKQYENYKYDIEEKRYETEKNLDEIKYKNEFLNKLKNINQDYNVENQKLKYNESKIDEIEVKIQNLIEEQERIKTGIKGTEKQSKEKINMFPYITVAAICIIIAVILFFVLNSNKFLAIIPIIFAILVGLVALNKYKKVKGRNNFKQKENEKINTYNQNLEKRIYELNAQIELLDRNKDEQIREAELIKNENLKSISKKKDMLKEEYSDKISLSSMMYFMNTTDLSAELEKNVNMMNEKNMEMHRLTLDKENILPKLDELAENEEMLSNLKEEYEALKKKNEAMAMVKEIIDIAYQKIRNEVTPKFTDNLSKNISYITEKKYSKVVFNENDGILVEMPNGEYKNANLLSKGTIQQLYIAFRLSLLEDISNEKMPVIFDEIFAYSDDNRIKETMKRIYDYSNNHQIILFTCTNREEAILKSLNIEFNKVNL